MTEDDEGIEYNVGDFGIDLVGEPQATKGTMSVTSGKTMNSSGLEELLQKFTDLQSTLDQRLAPLEKAVYGRGSNPARTAPAGGGSSDGLTSYDRELTAQEGQGIGDLESNAELAQLQLDAEEPQAKLVGEEAAMDEELRLNLLEEKSHLLPIKVGPDKNGRYLPLLYSSVEIYRDEKGRIKRDIRDNKQPLYRVKATYGYRWWEWMFFKKGRGIDKDSMMNNIYNHAKSAGVPFGSNFSRREFNPSICGEDFALTIYGPWRKNLLKGFVTGNRVEIDYVRPMSDTKTKKFILALEPEGRAYRKAEEDDA